MKDDEGFGRADPPSHKWKLPADSSWYPFHTSSDLSHPSAGNFPIKARLHTLMFPFSHCHCGHVHTSGFGGDDHI